MTGFFQELSRRKVPRVAAIYAIIGWAVIEAASVIFPALQLPDWTVTFVVVLVLMGFPVALFVSWVFDWSREGLVRTPGAASLPADAKERTPPGRRLDLVIIMVLLLVVAWLGWERLADLKVPPPAVVRLDSIAVLPFVNLSGDPENEYFGDGLAEELLNALVRVEGLRVAARTSSFAYKGKHDDIRRIGESLGVETILEGSVRKAGGRVRVTAQLIRTADGFHLWSDSYDRNLEDIFAVQDEISLAIVDALRVTLGAQGLARVVTRNTEDVEAFEAYLRGRYEMNLRTASTLTRAHEHFSRAIELDPGYAAAYSGLSDTWILRSSYAAVARDEAVSQAMPIARRAVELDPQLGEAHASLGLVLRHDDDLEGSIEPFLKAIELNPSYSPAYHWLALSYQGLGRFAEAVTLLRRAIEIDPQYVTGKRALLSSLRAVGDDAGADDLARRLAREHPSDPLVHYQLSVDAINEGRRVESFRHLVRAANLAPDDAIPRVTLAYQLLAVGDLARAEAQMEIVRQLNPAHPVLDGWEIDIAFQTHDESSLERAKARILAKPPGMERDTLACNAMQVLGEPAEALLSCRRLLDRSGWSSGDPITQPLSNPVGNYLLAAIATGDTVLASELLQSFAAQSERMEIGGLRPEEVDWIRAIVVAHRDGDNREMLRVLPRQLERGNWNWRLLHLLPLFEPVRETEEFRAMVESLRQRDERLLEEFSRIEVPGP